MNKIVLGTVQFGIPYGINNQNGKVSSSEVYDIINLAADSGINILDTSSGYGDSEDILGEIITSTKTMFRVVSKYSDNNLTVKECFEKSLRRLNQESLYGYLIHYFELYIENPTIWRDMQSLRESRKVEKIGFSLYTTDQLDYLIDNNVDFDIIQIPYNIFDRQFEPYFKVLKDRGVEVHTRSVFLQGLFFKSLDTLPRKLKPLSIYLSILNDYCTTNKISVSDLALNFALYNNFIDGVLIGVKSAEQLKNNICNASGALSDADLNFINSFNIKEKGLLNPVNWK